MGEGSCGEIPVVATRRAEDLPGRGLVRRRYDPPAQAFRLAIHYRQVLVEILRPLT